MRSHINENFVPLCSLLNLIRVKKITVLMGANQTGKSPRVFDLTPALAVASNEGRVSNINLWTTMKFDFHHPRIKEEKN